MDRWISCAPFERLLNMEIVEAEDARAILTMPFIIDLAQGSGVMHGGALVSLADTAMVMAIKSVVPAHTNFATIAMENRFVYPVKQGVVTAKAQIFERQGRLFNARCEVFNANQRQVMTSRSTFKIAKDARIKGVLFGDAENQV